MSQYRVLLELIKSGFGFSEQYITPVVSNTTAPAVIQAMLDARMAMLPPAYEVDGVGVSNISGLRLSEYLPPGDRQYLDFATTFKVPAKGTYPGGESTPEQSQEREAINFRLTFDTSRTTTRYVVGAPDDALSGRPLSFTPSLVPIWAGAYNRFRYGLSGFTGGFGTSAWFIRARTPTPAPPLDPTLPDPYAILGWQLQSSFPSPIGFQIQFSGAGQWFPGQKIHVYNTTMRPPNFPFGARSPSPRGNWFVLAVTPPSSIPGIGTVFLRGSTGVDPTQIKTLGRAFPVTYNLFPIQGAEGIRAGIHKRGKPARTPRGRRLTRLSLDP